MCGGFRPEVGRPGPEVGGLGPEVVFLAGNREVWSIRRGFGLEIGGVGPEVGRFQTGSWELRPEVLVLMGNHQSLCRKLGVRIRSRYSNWQLGGSGRKRGLLTGNWEVLTGIGVV